MTRSLEYSKAGRLEDAKTRRKQRTIGEKHKRIRQEDKITRVQDDIKRTEDM